MDQYKEMQDRLAKVGSRTFLPPAEENDYSELEQRLSGDRSAVPQVEKKDYSDLRDRLSGLNAAPDLSTPPAPNVPEAKSIPIVAPKLPEPKPPIQESISVPIAKPDPAPKPEPELEVLPPIPKNTVLDTSELTQSTSYFPRKSAQSKGRSNWILWVGVVLFVAFVIAQLIWVMS